METVCSVREGRSFRRTETAHYDRLHSAAGPRALDLLPTGSLAQSTAAGMRQPRTRRALRASDVDDSLRRLSVVDFFAQGMLPGLSENPREAAEAQRLTGDFKEYEQRLRELGLARDGLGLTNFERDLVLQIGKCAQNALPVLRNVDCGDASLTLDRAYKSGETVEENLDALIASRSDPSGALGPIAATTAHRITKICDHRTACTV